MTAPFVRILNGDVLDHLRELPDESVHCCVTSPPYSMICGKCGAKLERTRKPGTRRAGSRGRVIEDETN